MSRIPTVRFRTRDSPWSPSATVTTASSSETHSSVSARGKGLGWHLLPSTVTLQSSLVGLLHPCKRLLGITCRSWQLGLATPWLCRFPQSWNPLREHHYKPSLPGSSPKMLQVSPSHMHGLIPVIGAGAPPSPHVQEGFVHTAGVRDCLARGADAACS